MLILIIRYIARNNEGELMNKKLMKVAYKMPPQENWNAFRVPTQTNPNYITDELGKHDGMMDWNGKPTHVYYTNPLLGLKNQINLPLQGDYDVYTNGKKASLTDDGLLLEVGCGAFLFPKEN